jgi:hypothetical protein
MPSPGVCRARIRSRAGCPRRPARGSRPTIRIGPDDRYQLRSVLVALAGKGSGLRNIAQPDAALYDGKDRGGDAVLVHLLERQVRRPFWEAGRFYAAPGSLRRAGRKEVVMKIDPLAGGRSGGAVPGQKPERRAVRALLE